MWAFGFLPIALGIATSVFKSSVRYSVRIAVPAGFDIHSIKAIKERRMSIFRGTHLQLQVADNALAVNQLNERDLCDDAAAKPPG